MVRLPGAPRIAVVARASAGSTDAVSDHAGRLVEALNAAGADAGRVLRLPDGRWTTSAGRLPAAVGGYDLVVLEYNPFVWGRRGFAPWLVLDLWRLRLRRRRPAILIFFHETYVDLRLPWRWTAMALWQRLQLRLLRPAADVVFVSIERWAEVLAELWPPRPTEHVPVGSNLPDRREQREAARSRLGVASDDVVLATLSGGEPTRRIELVAAAVRAVLGEGRAPVLLALGAGGAIPAGLPPNVRVEQPGFLEADELARLLAAADIFLAPFADGVSTRRGSLMAALQHGIPVVGTAGHLTDDLWVAHRAAVRLVPVDRPDLFAALTVELARDVELRRAAGRAARVLYESAFDWPLVGARVLELARQ